MGRYISNQNKAEEGTVKQYYTSKTCQTVKGEKNIYITLLFFIFLKACSKKVFDEKPVNIT